MKLSICIATMGQLEDTKSAWGSLVNNTVNRELVELVVVDNSPTEETAEFLSRFIFPHFPEHQLLRHPDNLGVIPSLEELYHASHGDILAFLHNDVSILEHRWNERVLLAFETNPRLGLAGFLGAVGIGADGGRIGTRSNLLEAEEHGAREEGSCAAVGFDGLSLIARRAMLDTVGGFDMDYSYHHFYDRDISVANYKAGWEGAVIGIYCHHRSGVTANRPEYQEWISKRMGVAVGEGDHASYIQSERRFFEKWGKELPIIL